CRAAWRQYTGQGVRKGGSAACGAEHFIEKIRHLPAEHERGKEEAAAILDAADLTISDAFRMILMADLHADD
ncbi:MAG: hypothetical protein L0H63_13715, partial [Nitrococcus sp.]|nr:hypothetical protein [Nitrococcus sp.]